MKAATIGMVARPLMDIPGAARPGGHYSHAVAANGMLYISGQLPITASGEKLTGASFEQQARQTLQNISAVLEAAGADKSDLVQVRVYLADVGHWPRFNDLYAQWIGDWKPARAVVPVGALHYGLQVEVEAVALLRDAGPARDRTVP